VARSWQDLLHDFGDEAKGLCFNPLGRADNRNGSGEERSKPGEYTPRNMGRNSKEEEVRSLNGILKGGGHTDGVLQPNSGEVSRVLSLLQNLAHHLLFEDPELYRMALL
jgi:hypothetical protein